MNSYNDTIIPRIVEYVKNVTKRLENFDHQNRKVELIDYHLENTKDNSLDYLRLNQETEAFKLKFNFKITLEDNTSIIQDNTELFIPKMKNNVFIINGKIRVPTTSLNNSKILKVYSDKIVVNDGITINYDLRHSNPIVSFLILNNDGDRELHYYNNENYEQHKEYFKLSYEEKLKLQVKLDISEIGDYLTHDILVKLVKLGEDKFNDNIIDKQLVTVEDNLIHKLNKKDNLTKIIRSTRRKFYPKGVIYLTDIQNHIYNYFITANEEGVNIPQQVNPLVFDSLRYRIEIPKHIAYNKTFTDLIDVVNTPDNQNVNRINELNVCCEIDDGKIYIWCYEFDTGKRVKVLYLEYLNSNVLLNNYYDYEHNTELEGNEYYYKLRLKEYRVNTLENIRIEYVEPKPDEKLSISTRCIPMINNSDSIRVSMGTSMLKQAIEIEKSEPRLISSGNDNIDYYQGTLLVKNTEKNPIIIESIEDNKITYRDKITNSVSYFTIEDPIIGLNDVSITFTPKVKVGDELKYGDIVITPSIMKNESYDLGTNALVFYMNYLGYTNEDAVVISESFANRTVHYNIHDVSINLKSNDLITYIRKVGDKVDSTNTLINSESPLENDNPIFDFYRRSKQYKLGDQAKNYSKLLVPPNIDEGYIVDIKITLNPNNPLRNEKTINKINEFLRNPKNETEINLPDKYKNLKIREVIIDPKDSCNITFKIIRVNKTKVGDKLTNSWGSKGEVSLVLPDNEMPYRNSDGKIAEVLFDPAAVIARKNPSQL
jgi:DNA-directed RNA polymerase beta subunit